MPNFRWAKCLLTRADCTAWRRNLEIVASLYSILLRRAQMKAVHLVVVKRSLLTWADMEALRSVSAEELLSELLTSGDCDSLKRLLQRSGLDEKLRNVVRLMEIAFRSVRGSESEKLSLRKRFFAMRVRYGFLPSSSR